MAIVTVCTPTYNRGYQLERPFRSLMAQTSKNFEWLVIDDGSTDDTKKVIDNFKTKADFPIKYVYKSNGGRASALNESYNYIQTELVINLDSDDEYMSTTIESIEEIWNGLSEKERKRFWCITGQSIDSKTGKLIGGVWPDGINDLTGRKQNKIITKYKCGEKSVVRRVDILKENLFPSYPDTKFISEDTVWEPINKRYDQYCTNIVFRKYYQDSPDSLSSSKAYDGDRVVAMYYLFLTLLNECFSQFTYKKTVQRSIMNVSRFAMIQGRPYKKVMSEINALYKRLLVTLFYPVMFLYIKFK